MVNICLALFSLNQNFYLNHKTFLKGVNLVLSTLVDGKNINGGGHKLGLGLEIQA
jgi:hypothetical protein